MTSYVTETSAPVADGAPPLPAARARINRRRPVRRWIADIALWGAVALILVPFVFTVLTAFRPSRDVAADPLAIPEHLTLSNFATAFSTMNYGMSVLNSLIILVFSLFGTIVAGALAAYPLARITRGWTSWVYRLFIAGATVPVFVLIAPLYLLERDLGLLDTRFGVILAYAALNLPVAVFFYTSFFRQIPMEMEEAAALDGAGALRIFVTVLFPMLRPITATLATFLTLTVWNDLIVPLVFLRSPGKRTVMGNAYSLVGSFTTDPTVLFPAALLGVAPLVVVFILLQRQVVAGLTMGAVKG